MAHYFTKDGRRVSIFNPITQAELSSIPDARSWSGREDLISDASYQELQKLVVDAFAVESDDYILGFVSGFNGAMTRVKSMVSDEAEYETVWNNLMLMLSEAARFVSPDAADDETSYITLPEPGSQNN